MRPSFYPLSLFPALLNLARYWEDILGEYELLEAPEHDIARIAMSREEIYAEVRRRGLGAGWLQGWTVEGKADPHWLTYLLLLHDEPPLDVREHMPGTVALLEDIGGGIKAAALNKLHPHSLISKHSHPEIRREGLLQFHLCLSTGEAPCYTYLNVNGEFAHHLPGSAFVFDGSLPHFAVNATWGERVILYIEFQAQQLRRASGD